MPIQDDNDEALFLPADLTQCTGAVPGLSRSAICGKSTPHLAHYFSPSEQAEMDTRPNPGCTCAPDVNDGDPGTWCTTCRQGPRAAGSQPSGSAS